MRYTGTSVCNKGQLGPLWLDTTCALHRYQCGQQRSAGTLVVGHNLCVTPVPVWATRVSWDPCGWTQLVRYTGTSVCNKGQLGPLWLYTTCALHQYQCGQQGSAGTLVVGHNLCITLVPVWATRVSSDPKLQALVHDILSSTTAVFSYAIGSRKLSANEQFFVGVQTVISLLQTTQIKQGASFIAANKVYTSTNKTTIV